MKRFCFISLIFLGNYCFGQTAAMEQMNTQVYTMALELYNSKEYQTSLNHIDSNLVDQVKIPPKIHELIIFNLDQLYSKDINYGYRLEKSLDEYFTQNAFYEVEQRGFEDVVDVYVRFKYFYAEDDNFLEEFVAQISFKDTNRIKDQIVKLDEYLIKTPNTFNEDTINQLKSNLNDSLLAIRLKHEQMILDSIRYARTHELGKFTFLELNYYITPAENVLGAINNETDLINFLDGPAEGSSELSADLAVSASMFNLGFGFKHSNRLKVSLLASFLDGNVHIFRNSNAFFLKRRGSNEPASDIISYTVGMKFGLMVNYLVNKKHAIAGYFQVKPATNFLHSGYIYTIEDGNGFEQTFEIVPNQVNFNLSNEFGVRYYLGKNFYLGIFLNNGLYNWQNEIRNIDSGATIKNYQANYTFKYIGLKMGLL